MDIQAFELVGKGGSPLYRLLEVAACFVPKLFHPCYPRQIGQRHNCSARSSEGVQHNFQSHRYDHWVVHEPKHQESVELGGNLRMASLVQGHPSCPHWWMEPLSSLSWIRQLPNDLSNAGFVHLVRGEFQLLPAPLLEASSLPRGVGEFDRPCRPERS